MWKTLVALIAAVVCSCGVAWANPFAINYCQSTLPSDWYCVEIAQGETWDQLIPNSEYQNTIRKYNRQNQDLRAGQMLVVPPSYLSWNQLAPFAQTDYVGIVDVVVFDPQKLAWAHYIGGQLVWWGPAVGGKSWCPDVGRSCRTKVGTFSFTEAAGPGRRSNAYPVGCAIRNNEGKVIDNSNCAPMPYFTRFTSGGQGIHARSIGGANASHGCIGVFAEDARYINGYVRTRVGKTDSKSDWFTYPERQKSEALIKFVVLPYT
jgi:hypothetical protein